MVSVKPLAAGNWKMNGMNDSIAELKSLMAMVKDGSAASCEILICPPYTQITHFAEAAAGTPVMIGAQDCHTAKGGAHTGDISAEMLKDAGATHVIVGHSERRTDHGEGNGLVDAKAEAAWRAGLIAIICVGETEAERNAGATEKVVRRQLRGSVPDEATAANTVIAYEPVWAIGTGKTPTADDVAIVHAGIRAQLVERFGAEGEGMRILYGGSVKASNAQELMSVPNVNGALVGGASLKADDFNGIIDAYR